MGDRKVIEQTECYTIFDEVFDAEGADILFTDTFAQACGYASTGDMIAQTIGEHGKQEIIAKWGYLPRWVRVLDDGKIYFVGETFRVMGEA